MKNRTVALWLTCAMGFAALAPGVARAGEREAKNAAIGATAASAYLLSQKKTRGAGYVGAAGSVYLWKKYNDQREVRHKKQRARTEYYRRAAARNARAASYHKSQARAANARAAKARAAKARTVKVRTVRR